MNRNRDAISILAAGRGWLVAEKPAGLSIHNDPGRDLLSRLTREMTANARLVETIGWQPVHPPAAVHRLDRDTSGVVLVAVDPTVFRALALQFEQRRVQKRYTALLHGRLASALDKTEGWWRFALSETAGGRRDPAGGGRRKAADTRYRILTSSEHYTLISCEPVTGRVHQIRRHAKISGHPVVGDRRYGSSRALQYLSDRCNFNRLALHAEAITFQPPENDRLLSVCSPGLPAEIRRLIEDDGGESPAQGKEQEQTR